jgi:hypothetical protein
MANMENEDDRGAGTKRSSKSERNEGSVKERISQLGTVSLDDLALPPDDRNALSAAKIITLADWVAERDKVEVSPDTVVRLDSHARLGGLGVPKELASALFKEGIDSAAALASLSDATLNALEKRLHLSKDDQLSHYYQRAQDTTALVDKMLASTLINRSGSLFPWFGGPTQSKCGTCSEEDSIVGRFRYFLYLVGQTGKKMSDLELVLCQNLEELTSASGITQLPQITICNEVLKKRYPGALDAGLGWCQYVLAYLMLLPSSVVEVARRLRRSHAHSSNEADLVARLRRALDGFEVVFSHKEMGAFEVVALAELQAQAQADPTFASGPTSAIELEAKRRLSEALEPAVRHRQELQRKALKQRSGTPPKSDHELFRELYIETGLGSCHEISRLDQAISSLQAYLDDHGAATGLAVNGRAYRTYAQWRGDQLGLYYPELQAFLRDDVLSGESDSWDRGSIIRDRAGRHGFLQEQLAAVKRAIKDGYLAENADRRKLLSGAETIESLGLVAFKDSAYFAKFEEGLTVVDLVLEADDKMARALVALDSDEPGLAVAHLNDANDALLQVGELAFTAGSGLSTTWRLDYRELAALPIAERREQLYNAFIDLFAGAKKIFVAPPLSGVNIPGLNLSSGSIGDSTAWTPSGVTGNIGMSGYISFLNVSTRPDEIDESDANIINGATCRDVSLTDVQIVLYFTIESHSYSRAPASTDSYAANHHEMIGLAVRGQPGGAEYRIVIETALTPYEKEQLSRGVSDEEQPPLPPFWWTLSLYKVSSGGGLGDRLATLVESDRFVPVLGESYVLTVNTVVNEIRVDLATPDGLQRSLRGTDSSAGAWLSGFFGARATATVRAYFTPIFVESVTTYSLPPFYTTSREGSSSSNLRGVSIYDGHENDGEGMAAPLIDRGILLVYEAKTLSAEKLAIRFDQRPGKIWYLVFAGGTQAVSLFPLDQLLDRCLALSAYLRYAAIPVRMAQAYAASGDYGQAETMMQVVYDDKGTSVARRVIYPRPSVSRAGLTGSLSVDGRLLRLRLGEILISEAEWLFRQDPKDSDSRVFRLCTRILALYEDPEFCGCDRITDELLYSVRAASRTLARGSTERTLSGEQIVLTLRQLDRLRGRPLDNRLVSTLSRTLKGCEGSDVSKEWRALWSRVRALDTTRTNGIELSAGRSSKSRWITARKEAEIVTLAHKETGTVDSRSSLPHPPSPRYVSPLPPPFPSSLSSLLPSPLVPALFPSLPTNFPRFAIPLPPWTFLDYCIPANPIELEHKRRACLILKCLSDCCNVLGYHDDYIPPLRFDALLARARLFADLALSAERDLINFRERFETETFSLLQAQSATEIANATVEMERMRVSLTESEILTARFQHERTQASQVYYDGLVDGGLSDWEQRSLNTARMAIELSALSTAVSFAGSAGGAIASIGTGNIPGGIAGIGSTLGSVPAGMADQLKQYSQYYSMQAHFERRAEEWSYQAQMSRVDVLIAETNVDQAFQRRDIAAQQQFVAELQLEGAEDALHFLNNKFLNGAMYLWMMKTVREQYRKRLDYAIYAAYMAERALAFELQEPIKVIRFDYFDPRRDGLLGATKLQTDLATLAYLKLVKTKRKLQLSKTVSLLQMAPIELDRFKYGSDAGDLGRLRFRTLMESFDRDFPGHYLRLIKAVKVTVVALVPPTEGIRATLSASGVSKAVIGGPPFTERTIKRPVDSIALSAPFQATGLFVLNYEDELLLPFEGSGVETDWVLEMPKAANHFDYSTIADILITIEYTALRHEAYRAHVIERLAPEFSADRAFSLRRQFPDQWYDLHHTSSSPRVITLQIERADFPPNVGNDLRIRHLTLCFARKDGIAQEATLSEIKLTPSVPPGAAAVPPVSSSSAFATTNGIVGTRQPGGAPLLPFTTAATSPLGKWEMSISDAATIALFDEEESKLHDILLAITWSATAPPWPSA